MYNVAMEGELVYDKFSVVDHLKREEEFTMADSDADVDEEINVNFKEGLLWFAFVTGMHAHSLPLDVTVSVIPYITFDLKECYDVYQIM